MATKKPKKTEDKTFIIEAKISGRASAVVRAPDEATARAEWMSRAVGYAIDEWEWDDLEHLEEVTSDVLEQREKIALSKI